MNLMQIRTSRRFLALATAGTKIIAPIDHHFAQDGVVVYDPTKGTAGPSGEFLSDGSSTLGPLTRDILDTGLFSPPPAATGGHDRDAGDELPESKT